MSYLWKNIKQCRYCHSNIVHAGETYWKASKKLDSKGEPVRYPLNLHYTCGVELFTKGENLWEWSKRDLKTSRLSRLFG